METILSYYNLSSVCGGKIQGGTPLARRYLTIIWICPVCPFVCLLSTPAFEDQLRPNMGEKFRISQNHSFFYDHTIIYHQFVRLRVRMEFI